MRIFEPRNLEIRKAKMSTTQKEIAAVYWFASESNPNRKPYQTLQYTDGSTSCDCKGWTIKRATAGGARSCRHTRDVDAGPGERHSVKFEIYSQPAPRQRYSAPVPRTVPSQGTLNPRPG